MDDDLDLDAVGQAYLQHLTDLDLAALVGAGEPAKAEYGSEVQRNIAALRSEPSLVVDILERRETARRLLTLASSHQQRSRFSFVSPFLVFAAAIHRTVQDLAAHPYRSEFTGTHTRVPVFDSPELVSFLEVRWRRLFLAELLASYARLSSGVRWTETEHGWQRQSWNDLDPLALAMLLEDSSEPEKAGIWRRLGDAALFLTGIFPSYANKVGLGNRDGQALRHLSTVSQIREPVPESSSGLATLEWFGARWYALAAEHAVVQTAGSRLLQDYALHFDQARAILNTTADRYLYPFANGWLSAPAA